MRGLGRVADDEDDGVPAGDREDVLGFVVLDQPDQLLQLLDVETGVALLLGQLLVLARHRLGHHRRHSGSIDLPSVRWSTGGVHAGQGAQVVAGMSVNAGHSVHGAPDTGRTRRPPRPPLHRRAERRVLGASRRLGVARGGPGPARPAHGSGVIRSFAPTLDPERSVTRDRLLYARDPSGSGPSPRHRAPRPDRRCWRRIRSPVPATSSSVSSRGTTPTCSASSTSSWTTPRDPRVDGHLPGDVDRLPDAALVTAAAG